MAGHIQSDLCIVGAGALSIALAQHARTLGASVILVDRGASEPGDGPQQKLHVAALKASAAFAHAARHAEALGLGNVEPKIGMKTIQERARAVGAAHSPMTAPEHLRAMGIEIVSGATAFAGPDVLVVGDVQIKPRNIILAVGGKPDVPAIPGLEQIDYFTPDSILENNRKLTHLLVIGGNGDALALGQAFARFGSEVTLVPHDGLLRGHDPEPVAILLDALNAEGVRIVQGGIVREITPRSQGTGALVDLPTGETEALDVSHVLLATGLVPVMDQLAPEKAKVQPAESSARHYARGPLGQTGNRRIRVVGAAAGMDQWPYALAHGRAVVEQMILGAPVQRLAPQPHMVLTEPALAQIGRVSSRARSAKAGQHVLRANLAENAQARASGMAQGLAKVEIAPDGRIAGAGLVGPGAAEMAAVLAMAMDRDIPLQGLARLSLPDPSLLSSVVSLGEQALALHPVSIWTLRWRAMWGMLSFWKR